MATYKSAAYIQGNVYRPTTEAPFAITSTIKIPSGTLLAANDVFKFFKIGANVQILDITFHTSDLDTGTAITLDLGYDCPTVIDDDNAFLDNSTIGQAGGFVRVENGGDDPFAVGLLAAIAETITIQGKVEVAPTTDPATDRYLTVTARCQKVSAVPSVTPEYVYANRYSLTTGQATL